MRDTATEKEFDFVLQMLPDHVLHGGSTEAINGQQKYLTRTNTYKCYKTRKLLLKNVLAKSFFSVMK